MKFKLEEIVDITMGQSPKSEYYNNEGNGYPFLQGNRTFGFKYPVFDTYTEVMTKPAKAGDVIMSVRAPVGDLNITPVDMCLGRGVCSLRMKNGNQSFLYYMMKYYVPNLLKKESGTVFGSVNLKDISGLEIDIPNDEQVQSIIARYLEAIDDKIELNNMINNNLEQQAQAIYRERFEGVASKNLPFGWRVVALGDVATISNKSFNPTKESERMLEHYSIPAFDEARFPVFEPSASIKSNKFVIDASCFMISKLNPTKKRVWKPYCLTENAVCSTEFIVYKAKDKAITDFLYSVIDSSSFSDFMCSHVTGSTGSRQRTTPSDTLSYEFILPSEEDLADFQSLVTPMYAQMRINIIENDKLKRLRDSLLPKLMSGEIDVSNIEL